MTRVGVLLAVLACVAAALAGAPRAAAEPGLLIGVDDDSAKWRTRPDGLVATYRDLGLRAVRLTIPWQRGQNRPTAEAGVYLHRAATLVARGQRVVLAVYGHPWQAPLDDVQRGYYCDFLHHVALRLPVRDFVVWNEANSPEFWPPEGGAEAYEALLATCWDRLRRLSPAANLISTTAAHYHPAAFVRAIGDAYRASGRTRPIVTTFGHNPYPDNASEPPWTRHPEATTVGEGDLPRLLSAITDAFAGTAQPLPGMGRTSIWYLENGFQTTVPRAKLRDYVGVETDPWAVPPLAPRGADPLVRDQAAQLRDALLLAYCQPTVTAYFNFELIDEKRLTGWQSGVLWRDRSRKSSYRAFREAIEQLSSAGVDCAAVPGAGGPIPRPPLDEGGNVGTTSFALSRRSVGRRRRSARLSAARGRSSVG